MTIQQKRTIRRGDIYRADLAPVIGSEQGGIRPVLVIQNDIGTKRPPAKAGGFQSPEGNK